MDTGHIAPAPDDDLVVGARDQNGITAFANVEVGEILIFDAALSNPQVQQPRVSCSQMGFGSQVA